MAYRFYPSVLEKGDGGTYGVWFPDFPDAVAAARDHEEAMARAEEALAQAVEAVVERNEPLPDPTPFDAVTIPSGCKLVAVFAVRATPPDLSERVNVYLPKSLVERVDQAAGEMGMSRSSFFGMAVSQALRSRVLPDEFVESLREAGNPKPARYQRRSKGPQKP